MNRVEELAAEQAAYWNGPGGERWLAHYERIDRSIAEVGTATLALANAQPGERVIDIGCGTGGTTATLSNSVGLAGHVLGIDISETLIGAARARRLPNATFVVGDAATHPFHAASWDLVFSRFGVMFFAEPVPAFVNFQRALKPGGRLIFVCWRTPRENPWALLPLSAAQPFLPPLPRPGPEDPGQYSFGDRARVERILKAAGFSGIGIEPLDRMIWMGRDVGDVVANVDRFGPLARVFAEAEPAAAEKAKAAIAAALGPHESASGVQLPGACWLVSARAA
jgi:SAM-dependent methyltransferase